MDPTSISAASGEFVLNVGGGHHRLLATRIVVLVDAVQNAAFALSQSLAYAVVHSKTLRAALFGLASITNKTSKTPGVFEFFYTISNQRLIEIACLRISLLLLLGSPLDCEWHVVA
jgi:hypothetical protein